MDGGPALTHSRSPYFRTSALPHFRTSALPHFRTPHSALPYRWLYSSPTCSRCGSLMVHPARPKFSSSRLKVL
jgi:hypothetical protein